MLGWHSVHGHKHAVLYILIATHTGVDHVWSLCPCCLDCLEDVHCSFKFDSLNFRHASDKHTSAKHPVTERMSIIDIGELLMSSYMCAHTHTCMHVHTHTLACTYTHTYRSTCMSNHPYTCVFRRLTRTWPSEVPCCPACSPLLPSASVNWRTALSRPREKVEQGHLKGRLRALQTTVCEETY